MQFRELFKALKRMFLTMVQKYPVFLLTAILTLLMVFVNVLLSVAVSIAKSLSQCLLSKMMTYNTNMMTCLSQLLSAVQIFKNF